MTLPLNRPFTPRQRAILLELAHGSTNKAIAAQLGVCEQTVKWHVSKMLRTCAVANRAALVETTHDLMHAGHDGRRSDDTRGGNSEDA